MSQDGAPDSKLLPLRIRLPFDSVEQFIERYGANVTRAGVFIATRSTKPEGTGISFELVLQDGARLMRGEGVVAGVLQSDTPGQSGMQLRFVRLETRTKALVDQIVTLREGHPPLDVPAPVPSAPEAPPLPSAPGPAAPLVSSDAVLGIDLGTHACRAALVIDGQAELLAVGGPNTFELGSVVALSPAGTLVCGPEAHRIAESDPDRAVWGWKRLLGLRAHHRQAKQEAQRLAPSLVADPEGLAAVQVGARTFSGRALASVLLAELKAAADSRMGGDVHRAVLGVPSWFSDRQRKAVIDAAADIGLEVMRLVAEPSAAALAFGFGKGLARKRLLIYDFGAGTFDAAVVELTGDDLEVVTTGGDPALGGVDLDLALTAALTASLPEPARLLAGGPGSAGRKLLTQVEAAKISLAEQSAVRVALPGQGVDVELTRATVELVCGPLVERTLKITQAVLEAARISPQGVDEVLLLGGQSRMPLVQARLLALFGKAAHPEIDPQGAVARGAALLGAGLAQRERGKSGSTVADVLGPPVGVAVQGGGFRRVLEQNSRLPAEKTIAVPVTAEQAIQLGIFQGLHPRAEDNDFLGSIRLVAEKAGELLVRLSLSRDGVLEVRATLPGGKDSRALFERGEANDAVVGQLIASATLPGNALPETPSKGIFGGLRRLLGRP